MDQARSVRGGMLEVMLSVVALAASACGEEGAHPLEVERTFAIEQHGALLEASVVEGEDTLSVHASESEPRHYELDFSFGHARIGFTIDHEHGTGRFLPEGEPLDAVDAALVEALAVELARALPADEEARSPLQRVLLRQVSYLQIVPVGEQLAPFDFQSERGWVHLSCGCGRQYIGSGYYRTAGRGCGCTGGSGNGCKGRCGQGCGIQSTPRCVGTTVYTQDCAKHDYGLGSFSAASDDYAFASNNCSCSGVGSCY